MGSEAPSMGKLLEANRILLGTFSKIFSPAMRLGWIYAEPDVMEQLVTAKQAGDLHTNFFSQRVLYEYLRTNDIDEHIKSIRTLYKAQRDCMVSAIERCFPSDVSCTKPEGGMFLWLTLPEGVPATRLFDRAIGQKVAFVPGDPFYVGKKDVNAMRLNYSNASEPMIEAGVERLAQAYREMRD
jgi:2-aminoadipate transaminase